MSAPVYGDALRWIKRECQRADLSGCTGDDNVLHAMIVFTADLFFKEISDVQRDVQNLMKVRH